MSLNLVTLKEKEPSIFIWLWFLLGSAPQRKHHNHHLRGRLRNVLLIIITTNAEFNNSVVMLFLAWLDFMKLKYTQTKVAIDFSF